MNNKTLIGTILSLAIIFIVATNMQTVSAFCLAFCAPQETQAAPTPSANTMISIVSNTDWSATVADKMGNVKTINGEGSQLIDIACTFVYSSAVQKYSEYGYVRVSLVQDTNVLNEEVTYAPYGIAQISGTCPA